MPQTAGSRRGARGAVPKGQFQYSTGPIEMTPDEARSALEGKGPRGFRGGREESDANGYSQGPGGNARGFHSGAPRPRAGQEDGSGGPRGNRLSPLVAPMTGGRGADGIPLGDSMGRSQFGKGSFVVPPQTGGGEAETAAAGGKRLLGGERLRMSTRAYSAAVY
ncbi:hypothetical protein T492DRAFT_846875 [Pavlovales sp. CCMP2436]|nr:hypothetical protein T492DRAFT_846875 [Pavlovales sp. CCMP2436]